MKTFTIRTESDTERLARVLVGHLTWGDMIGLSGELGAGKTTFVRYLVGAMGGPVEQVSSPSFSLQNEYRLPLNRIIEHWDLYRLSSAPRELLEPSTPDLLRLVEWPERCPELEAELALCLRVELLESGVRTLALCGPRAAEIHARVEEHYGA